MPPDSAYIKIPGNARQSIHDGAVCVTGRPQEEERACSHTPWEKPGSKIPNHVWQSQDRFPSSSLSVTLVLAALPKPGPDTCSSFPPSSAFPFLCKMAATALWVSLWLAVLSTTLQAQKPFPSEIFPFRILWVDGCRSWRQQLKIGLANRRIPNAALFNSPEPHTATSSVIIFCIS